MSYYTPSISVICATFNRPKTVLRLLEQLDDQRCVDFRSLDVCIVEDGSDKIAFPEEWKVYYVETHYEVTGHKFRLKYIYRPRHSQNLAQVYSSRNLAASQTRGEYIFQCDDDIEFSPYLFNLLQSLAGVVKEEHWVWTPRISDNKDYDRDGHNAEHNWDRGRDGRWYDGRVYWHESHWGSADSSGMFMPRRTWDAAGGYDLAMDGTMGFGDQEFALRVQKLGARPGDVKLWIAPYFVNKADEEGGSVRMEMIHRAARAGRQMDNWEYLTRKHPDYLEWQNV